MEKCHVWVAGLLVVGVCVLGCGTSGDSAPPSNGGGSGSADGSVPDSAASPGGDSSLSDGSSAATGEGSQDSGAAVDAMQTTDGGLAVLSAPATSLAPLHVQGNAIEDPSGARVVLRGVAIPDLGALNAYGGGAAAVMARIDEILTTAGLAARVIRFPVYPRSVPNGGYPYYSPLPFPVGPAAPADAGATVQNVSAQEYVTNVLQPAVDYATAKKLYVIIDYHQIDDTTSGSGADAVTFWNQLAPVFSKYPNVLYEAFNEPIDIKPSSGWTSAFQAQAQSWVNAIRHGAPNNLIIVGSPSWSQFPNGAVQYPPSGSNLVYTAHIYPGNWNATFMGRVTQAASTVPVFVTEWGYEIAPTASPSDPNYNLEATSEQWVTDFRSFVTTSGASWTAWLADPSWSPPIFADQNGGLSDFGTAVKSWLASPGGVTDAGGATDAGGVTDAGRVTDAGGVTDAGRVTDAGGATDAGGP